MSILDRLFGTKEAPPTAKATATRTYVVCAVLGILCLSAFRGQSKKLTNNPQANQPVFIISASNNGLCWDLRTQDLYSDLPSARVQQFNCAGTQDEVFILTPPTESPVRGVRLILTEFGGSFQKGYVDAVPASAGVGSGVYAYKLTNQWTIQPGPGNNAYIQHLPDDQCVERPNTSSTGVQLYLRPCNGNPNQQWMFQPVTDANLLRKLKANSTK